MDDMPPPLPSSSADEEPAYADIPRRVKTLGNLLKVRTRFAAAPQQPHLLLLLFDQTRLRLASCAAQHEAVSASISPFVAGHKRALVMAYCV